MLAAIAECDRLGRAAFLAKYGYRPASRFHLVHDGRFYDSKPIMGVAFGIEYGCAALRPSEFSGGAEHCERFFRRLGFTIRHGARDGSQFVAKARRFFRTVLIVGLVSCTKSKLDTPAPARDLYSPSWVFARSAEYVERRCDEWAVLSAKHGVVHPDEEIQPYDETLTGSPKSRRAAWSAAVRDALAARYAGKKVKFVVMAGESYAGAVESFDHVQPLRGLETGDRRRWLKENV